MACKVVAIEHITLDGVYQSPARVDEDTRNNFPYGGWAEAGDNPAMQEAISKYMVGGWSLLVGSTTYAGLYEGWHVRQPNAPMTKALTGVEKFVASRNSNLELPWENSTLLQGEAADAVTKLKEEHNKTLVVFGSGVLLGALIGQNLVDNFLLMVHPMALGKGARLFESSPLVKFALTEGTATPTGILIANYELASH